MTIKSKRHILDALPIIVVVAACFLLRAQLRRRFTVNNRLVIDSLMAEFEFSDCALATIVDAIEEPVGLFENIAWNVIISYRKNLNDRMSELAAMGDVSVILRGRM